ncbi:gliding motility-associated C-terminal domain-containing protein [Polaribacter sp. MSW13]|uniref:Gliding motility-associated C-terminal domain-containing protein n=1 Tax=Polaribacter marinus TaxID=2916838 RepID=A0A9X2AL87_9FLAO|nr:gliding motility-associated C-terminal domain-containing protein [Polaribacter marinus]MCI2229005.1 gliding motility-associated C-terminal domain-containing protein [Polaribacter marinus]
MKFKNYLKVLFLTIACVVFTNGKTYSQQIYATSATELSSGNRVDNEANAAANNGDFATVRSYGGALFGIGAYAGELKLEFPNVVPANTTTYIRVGDGGTGLLDLLLGGSLGGVLSDVVGSIALGDHYIEVSALNASNVNILSERSDNITTNGALKVVRNKDGDVFFAITPTVDYKSVTIKDNTDALLLGTTSFINVYHAFYQDPAGAACNSEGIFTWYDGTGITLGLLDPLGVLGTTGVANPEYAIDNDDSTYSTIDIGIVSALATMFQEIQFPTVSSTKDQLEIRIRAKQGALVNVAVLQNITIDLYNGNIGVYSTTVDAAQIIALFPDADGEITKIGVTPGVQFDRLRVTLSSPLGVNLAQQVDLFGAKVTPAPPVLNPGEENQSFCTVQNAKVSDLVATIDAGTSLIWYNQAEGGVAYLGTDALIDGNIYYGATLNGACESVERVAVTVAISDSATPTTTNATQTFCATSNPKISDISVDVTTGVVTWYDAPVGGNAYFATDVLVDGNKYYAANTVGSCESSTRLEVTVTVTNPTTPTTVDANQKFCAVNAPTIANLNATASGTIIWYDAPTGGNAYLATDALTDGTKYYAANSNGTCESNTRLEVTVQVNDSTTPTTTETTQSFCTTQAPTIASLDATASGTIIWYDAATGGNAYLATDALVNGLKYYAANTDGTCESSTRLEVTVQIGDPAKPTATETDQSFCVIDAPTIANLSVDASAGNIIWYDQAVGGNAYASTDALTDATKYYAANSVGNCESPDRLEITVTISDTPVPTTLNANQTFCAVDNPTVGNLDATATGTITWYDAPTGGNAYLATDALTDGTKYYAANSDGTCESSSRLEVTVTVQNPATPTTVDASQSFCAIDSPTVANLNATASGTIIWYDAATGGNAYASTDALTDATKYYAANSNGTCESSTRLEVTVTVTNPTTPTTTDANQSFCAIDTPTIANLNATASGTIIWYDAPTGGNAYASTDALTDATKYYAANLNGGCESSTRLEVTVTVTNPTTPTTLNANQTFCAVDTPTIANLDATATGTIVWYNQATGGTAYASTDALTDATKYYAANSDGTCESSSRLEVTATVQNPATPTTVDASQSFCAIDSPTVANLNATASGTIIWYDAATGGNAYASTDALTDATKYYAANSNGTCESSTRLEVTVTVTNPTTPTTTDANQSFCAIDTPTIANLNATASGTIIWYDQATGGTAYASTDALTDATKYYAANLNGGCESSTRLEVTVTVTNPTTPTTLNANQTFCAVDTPTIANLDATATGTIVWYNQATGGTAYASTDALTDATKYYAANSDGTCESSSRLEVTATVQNPATPTTVDASQSFCAIDSPTVANLNATASGTIIWYDAATGGNAYASTDALTDATKYYAANSNGTCESSTRLEVTVTVTNPTTPTTTDANQSFCAIDTPTVANLNATASGTIIWYDAPTGGNAYASTDALTDATKYYAANSEGTCESSTRLEVTVTVSNPTTPTTTDANQSFCAVDNPTIANLNATASGTIIWYDAPTGGNVYASTDALTDATKYYAANSEGTCESSSRLEVTVSISDTSTPTTTNINQTFCSVNNPKVSDLDATATGTIIWYNTATGGTAYADTDDLTNGIYYAANSDGTCESSNRLEVTVTITTGTDITISGNNTDVCFGTVETYEAPAGYAPYTWNITGGNIVSGGTANDNTIEVEWTNLTNTKVSVDLTGGCFNSNSAEQIVQISTCSDLTIKKEVDFIEPNVGDIITFTIEVENSALSVFTNLEISEVLTNGFIYVSSNATLGSYDATNGIWDIPTLGANQVATLTIKAEVNTSGDYLNTASITTSTPEDSDTTNNTVELLVTPSCLKVYNVITPNGDTFNDYFVISCIGNFSNTQLEIFDRYGSIVYKMKNYNNDWNGIANQTSKIIKSGQKLPNGTYFYVLKFNDGSANTKKGWIQITK